MSVPVDLAALEAAIADRGPSAFLVTSSAGGGPHVVSVHVAFRDATLTMPAGQTSRRNAAASPAVTLLWPGAVDADYCLLVDGTAVPGAGDADDGTMSVRPTGAILHRLASAPADLPSCEPVTDPPTSPPHESSRA